MVKKFDLQTILPLSSAANETSRVELSKLNSHICRDWHGIERTNNTGNIVPCKCSKQDLASYQGGGEAKRTPHCHPSGAEPMDPNVQGGDRWRLTGARPLSGEIWCELSLANAVFHLEEKRSLLPRVTRRWLWHHPLSYLRDDWCTLGSRNLRPVEERTVLVGKFFSVESVIQLIPLPRRQCFEKMKYK